MKQRGIIFIILILTLTLSFVSAQSSSNVADCTVYGNCKTITPSATIEINESLFNVNNSLYWQGHTGTDGSWLTNIIKPETNISPNHLVYVCGSNNTLCDINGIVSAGSTIDLVDEVGTIRSSTTTYGNLNIIGGHLVFQYWDSNAIPPRWRFLGSISSPQDLGSVQFDFKSLFTKFVNITHNISAQNFISTTGFINNGTANFLISDLNISSSSGAYNSTYENTTIEWNGNKSLLLGALNNASYLSTLNSTYNNLLNQDCPNGYVVNGTYSNGTFKCTISLNGAYNSTYENTTNQWNNNYSLYSPYWYNMTDGGMNYNNLALTNKTNYFSNDQVITHSGYVGLKLNSTDGNPSFIDFIRVGAGRDWRMMNSAGTFYLYYGGDDVNINTALATFATTGITSAGEMYATVFRGNDAGFVKLTDNVGNSVFRGRHADNGTSGSGWTDTVGNAFFQVGIPGDNITFTSGNGVQPPRIQFPVKDGVQITNAFYTGTQPPTHLFEVLNNSNNVLFGVKKDGNITLNGQITTNVIMLESLNVTKNVNVQGNITGNLLYGGMWFDNDSANGQSMTIAGANTWYNITMNITTDRGQELNGFSFVNGNALKCSDSGLYSGSYSVSFESSGINKEYNIAVSNGTDYIHNSESHTTMTVNSDAKTISSPFTIRCSPNLLLTLQIREVSGTDNIGIHHAKIFLQRIGN